jgi:hypothetical protein
MGAPKKLYFKWKDSEKKEWEFVCSISKRQIQEAKKKIGIYDKRKMDFLVKKLSAYSRKIARKYPDIGIEIVRSNKLDIINEGVSPEEAEAVLNEIIDYIPKIKLEYYLKKKYLVAIGDHYYVNYQRVVNLYYRNFKNIARKFFEAIGRPEDSYILLDRTLSFCQSLPYSVRSLLDRDKEAPWEFPSPWEVLYYGKGDDQAKAVLFACLWKNLAPDINFLFVIYDEAVTVAVENIWKIPGDVFISKRKRYVILDTLVGGHKPDINLFMFSSRRAII